jgi:hypothetical protein
MKRLGRRLTVSAVALPLVLLGATAHAQSSGMSNEMRAEYLFRSGEKKFDAGKHAEACADFTESLRLGPKLGTLLNLALCHETIGKPATAWSEYQHGAVWAAQNGQKDRHDFALQHALALETKLPRVLLHLPADRAIASVDVDGEPLPDSRWYLPIFLDPGEHSVTLAAPGKQRTTVKFRVVLSPTEQLVSVPTLADVEAPPAAPATPLDPDHGRRLAGYALLGAGGVGLALGATFGLLAVSKRDEIGSRCHANHCTPDGADLYRTAQTDAAVATWSSVIGVAAGALGGWLVLTSEPARRAPKVGIAARPDGATLAVGGTF